MRKKAPTGRKLKSLPSAVYVRTQHLSLAESLAASRHSSALATGLQVCNSNTSGRYLGVDLTSPAIRPGADAHKALPSRYMDQLIYRDRPGVAA
jgi:hypothetical protein